MNSGRLRLAVVNEQLVFDGQLPLGAKLAANVCFQLPVRAAPDPKPA